NRQDVVANLGIAPTQIVRSPWQNNGETALFLTGHLALEPTWVLYTREISAAYRAIGGSRHVAVKHSGGLAARQAPAVMALARRGRGVLVARDDLPDWVERLATVTADLPFQAWTAADGAQVSAEPQLIVTCRAGEAVTVKWDFSNVAGVSSV